MRRRLAVLAVVLLAGVAATLVLTGVAPLADSPSTSAPETGSPPSDTAVGGESDGSGASGESGESGESGSETPTPLLDSDGDGLADGEAVELGSDPTTADTDDDALSDGREVELGTNPTSPDTDGDGIGDVDEVELGTDPALADSDGDRLTDPEEAELGTNATVADTDADGLNDSREVELEMNATAADTDGDGLDDGRETELGTNATAGDTDGDGLADGRELELGGDPLAANTDGDGLVDGREAKLGTNLTLADTDGDTLSDDAEVAGVTDGGVELPNADPLRMDLYVQVDVSDNAEAYDEGELDDLADAWREMSVDNPDGSTGIDLHTDQGELNESLTVSDDTDYVRLKERSDEFLGNRSGVYHNLLLVEIDADFAGRAPASGTFSVVATRYHTEFGGTSYRTFVGVHELLHNVAGRLDEDNRCSEEFDGEAADYHTCEGWLSYDDPADSQFLPDGVATELARDGLLKG